MDSLTFLTLDQIIAKHRSGQTLTAWESSVYRLNVRDDGTRYSADPKEREAQYAADNVRIYRLDDRRTKGGR